MAKWLILKERALPPASPSSVDERVPPGIEPEAADPDPYDVDVARLEPVGIAEANADQPKAAGESVAHEPGCRYFAVRWDSASVFDADPRPVALTEVKKGSR